MDIYLLKNIFFSIRKLFSIIDSVLKHIIIYYFNIKKAFDCGFDNYVFFLLFC